MGPSHINIDSLCGILRIIPSSRHRVEACQSGLDFRSKFSTIKGLEVIICI